jgi:hypothetical protein
VISQFWAPPDWIVVLSSPLWFVSAWRIGAMDKPGGRAWRDRVAIVSSAGTVASWVAFLIAAFVTWGGFWQLGPVSGIGTPVFAAAMCLIVAWRGVVRPLRASEAPARAG